MNTRAFLISTLIAGAVMGLLSNIPLLNLVNCLLCAWLWGGGILAVFLYRRFAPEHFELTSSNGILLGLVAGVFGAVIGAIVSVIFQAATQQTFVRLIEQQELFRSELAPYMDTLRSAGGFSFFGLVCNLIFYPLFGLVGGLLGVNFFKGKAA